jgi:hypothetical protein
MRIRELVKTWETQARTPQTVHEYHIRLPLDVAAKVYALAEMYPARTDVQIITELLGAALHDLEASFPYVRGSRVIAEDEFGDPVYEDAGLTPRFTGLTRKHFRTLQKKVNPDDERGGAD